MTTGSGGALQPVPDAFVRALRELRLVDADETPAGEPLAGGVSSDIWRIETRAGTLCAKRALPQLRVAADWRAPVERNRYEARWMQVADAACPGSAPRVLGQHPELGVLAMAWLPPDDHPLWKPMLAAGRADAATAAAVGRTLVRIHAHAAARPAEMAAAFDSGAIFLEIRLDPYLLATAARHPDLAATLRALVDRTRSPANARSLVHGDVSPKNIVVGPHGPVLLDAECAWWGDPAFDVAFCLNHLLLKCLLARGAAGDLLAAFDALAAAYRAGVDWEPADGFEARAATLLPALLLARVDGKSPVEYLTGPDRDADRAAVRRCARALLLAPRPTLAGVRNAWMEELHR